MNIQDIEDIYELSPLQEGMLFHGLYEPESRLYFEQVLVPFEGLVNPRALEGAWNHVAGANPVLRTSVHWDGLDKPLQVVHKKGTIPVEIEDLRTVAASAREARIEAVLAADRDRGFDLQRAPLLRVTLLQLTGTGYRLLLSFHHIILDGWSLQLVFRRFSEAYQALCLGRTPGVPRARPYSDYIRWLQGQDLGAAREYWTRTLAGVDRPCRLTHDSAAEGATAGFAEHTTEVSAHATAQLRESASRHRLTLNTLVQGAWALLLHRLTQCEDIVFGVVASGRPAELPDVQNMVGMFINTVPLRVRVEQEARVAEWLHALQKDQFEARQFDYSPLVRIGEWSSIAGSRFDTLLAFENYPVQTEGMGGAASATFVERTNYPLSAAVVPGRRLQVRLLYNGGLFARETVVRIGEQYQLILESLASGTDRKIGELETLTRADRQLFAALNQTTTEYPSGGTVTALWQERVAISPGAPALEFGARTLTYAELDRLTDRVAVRLRSLGVGGETTVGVLLPRSVEFIVAALGILKAGGAYVPLDTAYPPARVNGILDDVGVRFVITNAGAAGCPPEAPVQVLSVDDLLTPSPDRPTRPLGDLSSPEATAYVMYTSGSTGTPKGIMIPHRGIVRLVRNTNYIELRPADRVGHISSCAFDAATFEIWGALLNGSTVVGVERHAAIFPETLAAEIRERRISVLFITTALFNQVIAERPDAFASLRVLLFGGEAVSPRWVRAALHAGPPQVLCHVYGPTETTTFATWHRVERVDACASNVPIGRPISNTMAYVLDTSLRPVPAGAVGELYIGGDGLARGYHGKPSASASSFLPDPFSDRHGARMYRTGDKVRWRPDGSIDFLGRLDLQVKVRGYRIELGEIERRLEEHPQVLQAAAVVRTDSTGSRSLVAFYVPSGTASGVLQNELRKALREHLPEYMQPAAIQAVDALPLNRNGKVDHDALPELDAARPGLDEPFLEPRDEVERKLASIWQQVLGLQRVGVHDAFLDIGGHSLRATQVVSRVRREFGVEIPLRAVFENPTIARLAEFLRQGSAPASAATAEIGRVSRDQSRRVLA